MEEGGAGGVDGVEGVEGVDGADGAELSASGSSSVPLEGGVSSALPLDEVGGVKAPLSSAAQAKEGSRNAHAKRSAANAFAFFIKYLTNSY